MNVGGDGRNTRRIHENRGTGAAEIRRTDGELENCRYRLAPFTLLVEKVCWGGDIDIRQWTIPHRALI